MAAMAAVQSAPGGSIAQATHTQTHTLQRKLSHQQFHPGHAHQGSTASSTCSSYNGQGSIATMQDLYEVGEVIGTGTFGIIRKVSHHPKEGGSIGSSLARLTLARQFFTGDKAHRWIGK